MSATLRPERSHIYKIQGWVEARNPAILEPTFRTLKCHTQVLTLQAFEFKGSNA